MLAEALIALAAAGGTAVVQAAGTDAWEGLRGRVARWFGRGDVEVERAELERLDRSASELSAADEGETDRIGARQEAAWQARFETLLERLPEAERAPAAAELQDLIDQSAPGASGRGAVSGNTFQGPTAVQVGDHNRQDNRFGSGA
ncbi:hypothetical protein [Streptomyces sp. NPDC005407]|uniref:hypothetical protein n=1 Tax=Streptomyces sp. NPDC005407 TaxID=3155340 RepID=UPI0033BC2C18